MERDLAGWRGCPQIEYIHPTRVLPSYCGLKVGQRECLRGDDVMEKFHKTPVRSKIGIGYRLTLPEQLHTVTDDRFSGEAARARDHVGWKQRDNILESVWKPHSVHVRGVATTIAAESSWPRDTNPLKNFHMVNVLPAANACHAAPMLIPKSTKPTDVMRPRSSANSRTSHSSARKGPSTSMEISQS